MDASHGSAEVDAKVNPTVQKLNDAKTGPEPTAQAPAFTSEVEDVPDPDEDDLDDLDDMLDEFSTVNLSAPKPSVAPDTTNTKPTPKADAPRAPTQNVDQDADFSEEDFAKQLQEGMANLLGELEKSPDMQAQFENMFKQMASEGLGVEEAIKSGESARTNEQSSSSSAKASAEDQSFQETIRRTMERMQTSGDQATAAAASGGADDFMSEMLKQLSSGDFNAEGSEEEFSKMLMGMMEQLTNKDILYEPMKELHDKFPDWLEKNRAKTAAEDLKRYEEQQAVVSEIVAKFEEKTYSDSNAADREYIVDRMQKMQAAGSPPPDLVGDMESAQEAFNMPDEQCNPQ